MTVPIEAGQVSPQERGAPYRVSQTYWRGVNLPRYLVIGPGNESLHTRPTLHRPYGITRTWKREADAQAVADECNQRAADSAAELAARIAARKGS